MKIENKKYKSLCDYYYKNKNTKNELRTKMIDEILENEELLDEIWDYLNDNDLSTKSQLNLYQYLDSSKYIFQYSNLWSFVDKEIKKKGMNSSLIYLAERLQRTFDEMWEGDFWVEVDEEWGDFYDLSSREILNDFLNELDDDQLIQVHQFVKEQEKQNEQQDENNLIKETKDEMEME
ncbi:Mbov_0392 family ICE element protein [[Mycoplasma] collis]|uniref:Mbov_0392 family ICE element protein n=1 Tax=[Mycoplasma] collis TaxID=2127 RepID=UPI00051B44FE|nr:hypothetical protein [[Mycoplasma] collis]